MTVSGLSHEEMKKVVLAAGRAPSGDNIQPWHFSSVDGGRTLKVCINSSEDVYTQTGRIHDLICIGAALENARIAANVYYGRQLNWKTIVEKEAVQNGSCVVTVEVGDVLTDRLDQKWIDAIFKRHTNRFPFDQKPLSVSEQEIWQQAEQNLSQELPGAKALLFDTPESLQQISNLIARATPLIFSMPSLRAHIFTNIIFTKEDEPLPPVGMPIGTVVKGKGEQLVIKALRNKTFATVAARMGLGKVLGKADAKTAKNAAGFGLMLAKSLSTIDLLRGGAAMQKMWLACTMAGLAVQPMTTPMLHTWFVQVNESDVYTAKQWRQAKDIANDFTLLFKSHIVDSPESVPVMFFRMGHAEPSGVRSNRLPIDDILSYSNL